MTRRLRVATVITRLQAGAGAVALRGALALDPQRFESVFVIGSGDRLVDEARDAGFTVITEPTLRPTIELAADLAAPGALATILRGSGVDVVHTHSAKAGVHGRLAARRAGVKRVVHTYHGFPFHEFQSAPRRAAYVAIERRLGRITDVGLCVGTAVAAEVVRRRLLAPDRVRTIGVPVDGVGPAPGWQARAQARRALGLPVDAVVVGAVGRLAYQKAPEDFVAAMLALSRPEVIGVWIGDGPDADRVRALARAAAPRARVLLLGERRDVPALLPAFDVFALPSRYEGLPVAIVEAMRAGVPVVASAVNSVPDVVIAGRTGLLVAPQAPGDLARAIAHLLDHPAEARRMAAAAGRRSAEEHHSDSLRQALAEAYTGGGDAALSLVPALAIGKDTP